ncbi:hypothetical protein [Azorhizobium doebereinerae]|uniref:hypothetical protein n=1 Tax=Azorhizobium doebereinerae TaxID=281091 RepID=UPI00040FA308|nr:hypothetical protein [Azorhizobium doebereinerae]
MSDPLSSDPSPQRRRPSGPHRSALRPLFMVLAVLFLIEAWLWEKTAPMVAWVARHIPFEALKHAIARWARRLPPYGALVLFVVPLILIEPINILALWFYAHKEFVLGSLCFLVAKLVGVGLMAFLFEACRAQLRSIRWFARLCDGVLAINAWAHRQVEPYKVQLKEAFAAWTRGRGNGFWRRVMDIRRRAFRS